MANLAEALQVLRSLLNDNMAVKWPDPALIPKLQTAHRQLQLELALNSIPIVKEQSAVITVTAGDLDLGANQPAGMIEPIALKERDVGGTATDFEQMVEVSFLPQIAQDTRLVYWAWYDSKVNFIGATTNREVLLRYINTLTVPSKLTEDLGIPLAELFLAPQAAFIATGDDRFAVEASSALDRLVRTHVKGEQGVPRRRLPYRFRGRRMIM